MKQKYIKMMEILKLLFFIICLFQISAVFADLELVILHNNDMHSRFDQTSKLSGICSEKDAHAGLCYGGFARVANIVRSARAKAKAGTGPQVLFLNAGDTSTGTAWYTVYRWNITAEFLNILQPDAMSLGNHEFDAGVKGLAPLLNALEFPVVTANVDFTNEPELAATPLTPSTILTVNGVKIGVIGYLTPETQVISQTEKVIFRDEVETLIEESEKLKNQGVKTIIALGHSGFEVDKKIAEKVPLVDIVIGGHTNTFLYNGPQPDAEVPEGLYPTEITQPSGKKVPVVQAYAYTKYMGMLNIIIDDNGNVKSFTGQPILLNSTIPQEEDVLALVEKYRPGVDELEKSVVGRTKVLLDQSICRTQECNIGNLVADAFVAYKSFFYAGNYWTDTPIGIQNGGGIKTSIDARDKAGNITRGELLKSLPFDNRMSAVTLKGSDLLQVLEISVRSNGETSGGEFLQFSGLKLIYDSSKPTGSRVISASVRCGACNVPAYEPILPDKEYRMMITQYLLNGGDGYTVIRDNAYNIVSEDVNDAEMVIWYLEKYNPVFPDIESRIINIAVDSTKNLRNSATKLTNYVFYFIGLVTILINNY